MVPLEPLRSGLFFMIIVTSGECIIPGHVEAVLCCGADWNSISRSRVYISIQVGVWSARCKNAPNSSVVVVVASRR